MLLELADLGNGGPPRRYRAPFRCPDVLEFVLGLAWTDDAEDRWVWRRGRREVRCLYGRHDHGPAKSIPPAAVTGLVLDWLDLAL